MKVYSQSRGELLFLLQSGLAIQWVLKPPTIAMFCRDTHIRKSRNVASVLAEVESRQIAGLYLAEGDRTITLATDSPSRVYVCLYGPRPNVYLIDHEGRIKDSFRGRPKSITSNAPRSRPVRLPASVPELRSRWQGPTKERALRNACPLLDATLANEVFARLEMELPHPDDASDLQLESVLAAIQELVEHFRTPKPRVYWNEAGEGVVALTRMESLRDHKEERFDTINDAVRVATLETLRRRKMAARRSALTKVVNRSLMSALRAVDNVQRESARPSRHEEYERWGHLLMATERTGPGRDHVTVEDLFEDGSSVTIAMDASLDTVGNAQLYYNKARKARRARKHLVRRLNEATQQTETLRGVAEELEAVTSIGEMDKFERRHASIFHPMGARTRSGEGPRFRKYDVGEGYELWVSRNQGEADRLTFRFARKYDIWLHARGCSGAHAVLRLPHRDAAPGKYVLERAAGIAAYHSKGRHSALVPVIVTPRKYVRKPKGVAPGEVVVDREEVLLVPPEVSGPHIRASLL